MKGGFKTIRTLSAQDAHKPKGKYTILTTIAEKYTTNPGHPGNSTPVMDELYNTFLIPQMFAEVAQDKSTPEGRSRHSRRRHRPSTASGRTRGSCRPAGFSTSCEGPDRGLRHLEADHELAATSGSHALR